MELIYSQINRENLPIPNKVEIFLTDIYPYEADRLTAVFCLIFYKDSVLFTTEADAGHPDIDVPGGHIETGETPEEAVVREVYEETGVTPDAIQLVAVGAYTLADAPNDYRYPNPSHNVSYVGYVHEKQAGNQYAHWITVAEARKTIPWVQQYRMLFEAMYQEVKYVRGDFKKTYLDVYDDTGTHVIDIKTYDQVHRQGLWHKGVHVWILNDQNQFLIQKRSSSVNINANLLENSIGGHIDQGNTSIQTAIEECKEELGLAFLESDFEYVGTIVDQFEHLDGTIKNNEFDDVYIVRKNIQLEDMTISKIEVGKIVYIDARTYLEKGIQGDNTIVPRKQEYELLYQYLGL